MPVYTYECDCTEYERICSVEDRDRIVGRICKHCEKEIRRRVDPCTFILKEGGVGWANTGYTGVLGEAVKNGGTFKSD
jgi:predicted nucleic acid-binding Zn ribbon protein